MYEPHNKITRNQRQKLGMLTT